MDYFIFIFFGSLFFSYLDAKQCGRSQSFANFRRPKPLIFSDVRKETDFLVDYDSSEYSNRPRIINGQESLEGAWPWQVSIELKNPIIGDVGHWCGGVLIDSQWVATAAHCVKNKMLSALGGGLWTVILGDWDRSYDNEKELKLVVEDIVVHPNFTDYDNDVALLKLPRNYQNQFTPVCLPPDDRFSDEDSYTGLRCVATGWGQTSKEGTLESKLHQSVLRVVNTTDCARLYSLKYGVTITSGHVCAGPDMGTVTRTCVGDSGGPLQCNFKDGKWYLVGLTSFGSGCAKPGFPDVFVRISHFSNWIQSVINENIPR